MKRKISITLEDSTLKEIDSLVDNIYVRNRSQAIELLVNDSLGEKRTAVILSGGPEEDLRINKEEYRITIKTEKGYLIENTLKKLKEFGFKKIYLVARKEIINAVFSIIQNGSMYGINFEYIEEKKSNGTADSLRLIKGKINSNFLVVYGDVLFSLNLDELWEEHLRRKGTATLLLNTSGDPSRKGIVKIEGTKITEFIQKPEKSDVYLGFASIFICGPEILEYGGESLEFDLFPELAKKGLLNGYLSTSRIIKVHSRKDLETTGQ